MKQLFIATFLLVSTLVYATDPTISSKVLKSFNKHFAKAEDVNWIKTDKASYATFEQNGIMTTASFDDKGHVVQMMRYSKANILPDIVTDALNVK